MVGRCMLYRVGTHQDITCLICLCVLRERKSACVVLTTCVVKSQLTALIGKAADGGGSFHRCWVKWRDKAMSGLLQQMKRQLHFLVLKHCQLTQYQLPVKYRLTFLKCLLSFSSWYFVCGMIIILFLRVSVCLKSTQGTKCLQGYRHFFVCFCILQFNFAYPSFTLTCTVSSSTLFVFIVSYCYVW